MGVNSTANGNFEATIGNNMRSCGVASVSQAIGMSCEVLDIADLQYPNTSSSWCPYSDVDTDTQDDTLSHFRMVC